MRHVYEDIGRMMPVMIEYFGALILHKEKAPAQLQGPERTKKNDYIYVLVAFRTCFTCISCIIDNSPFKSKLLT